MSPARIHPAHTPIALLRDARVRGGITTITDTTTTTVVRVPARE